MDISEVQTIGTGILRPEGVMALDDGTILTADGREQCARIQRDGKTSFFGSVGGLPNGICVDKKGDCIIANIGNGEVQSLALNGDHEVLLTEVDGKKMTTPNFPFVDSKERLWVSNSTYHENLETAIMRPIADGCVFVIEGDSARIVAEDIYFANGIALDDEEKYLYVAESMARDILRFRIADDGSLNEREVYGPTNLGPKGVPDGIAFDEAGNLWVTFPMWNAVGYITPGGELKIELEDPDDRILHRPTNICFGWEGRRTAFLGSIDGRTIPYFEAPYPGMRLVHQS
ncbi:SMP-30/gluconolactonase/LRE family protein [Thermodesulfobacteriota bacterium]